MQRRHGCSVRRDLTGLWQGKQAPSTHQGGRVRNIFSVYHEREKKRNCIGLQAENNSCLLRNKLSVLDWVQKSSCTLRLHCLLIDFQPGTTSTKHYATGLGPTRGPGALVVCRWRDLQLNLFSAEWSSVGVVRNILFLMLFILQAFLFYMHLYVHIKMHWLFFNPAYLTKILLFYLINVRSEEEGSREGEWNWKEYELWGVFSLAAIIVICSVVITTLGVCCLDETTDGGGQWSSYRWSSSHLLQAATYPQEVEDDDEMEEREEKHGGTEVRCTREQYRENGSSRYEPVAVIWAVSSNRRRKIKLKRWRTCTGGWLRMRRRSPEEENDIRGYAYTDFRAKWVDQGRKSFMLGSILLPAVNTSLRNKSKLKSAMRSLSQFICPHVYSGNVRASECFGAGLNSKRE